MKNQNVNNSEIYGLVYARVSSRTQKNDGHGLESQEQRCIERLKYEQIPYIKTFKDSYTGGDGGIRTHVQKLRTVSCTNVFRFI